VVAQRALPVLNVMLHLRARVGRDFGYDDARIGARKRQRRLACEFRIHRGIPEHSCGDHKILADRFVGNTTLLYFPHRSTGPSPDPSLAFIYIRYLLSITFSIPHPRRVILATFDPVCHHGLVPLRPYDQLRCPLLDAARTPSPAIPQEVPFGSPSKSGFSLGGQGSSSFPLRFNSGKSSPWVIWPFAYHFLREVL
jgi:hypothetical protein